MVQLRGWEERMRDGGNTQRQSARRTFTSNSIHSFSLCFRAPTSCDRTEARHNNKEEGGRQKQVLLLFLFVMQALALGCVAYCVRVRCVYKM